MKNPTPFKIGDWVIVKKGIRKKEHYPTMVFAIDDERGVTYAKFNSGITINPYYFELATEEEIKIYNIKNMF